MDPVPDISDYTGNINSSMDGNNNNINYSNLYNGTSELFMF